MTYKAIRRFLYIIQGQLDHRYGVRGVSDCCIEVVNCGLINVVVGMKEILVGVDTDDHIELGLLLNKRPAEIVVELLEMIVEDSKFTPFAVNEIEQE